VEKKKRREGRPSKLDDSQVIEQAGSLYRLFGATDEQIASFFKVTARTVENWKKSNPEFFQVLKDAKAEADDQVELSLFKRAKGYTRTVERLGPGGVVVPCVEEMPPDPVSCIFWLKNRRPKQWRDKQDIEQINPQPMQLQFVDAPKQESMTEWLKRRGQDEKPS
jgi:hypothetical protein